MVQPEGDESCNGQTYSQDLRERILAAVDSRSAVRQARDGRDGGVSAAFDATIAAAVKAPPEITVSESRVWVLSEHGASISHAGMWAALDRLGPTAKKDAPRGRAAPADSLWRSAPGATNKVR